MKNVTPDSDQVIDVDVGVDAAKPVVRHAGGPVVLGTDPKWDRARELLRTARTAYFTSRRALAEEIERLRLYYLGQGHGGKGRGNQYSPAKVPSGTSVPLGTSKGFQAKLAEELGLHHEQARRILEAAAYEVRIEAIALAQPGEEITWLDAKGEQGAVVVSPDMIATAREALDAMQMPGGPRPARAWAGVASSRVTKGVERAPVDSAKQIRNALRSLQVHMQRWGTLAPDDQALLARIALDVEIEALLAPLIEGARRFSRKNSGR